jgi:hypothetical protein
MSLSVIQAQNNTVCPETHIELTMQDNAVPQPNMQMQNEPNNLGVRNVHRV